MIITVMFVITTIIIIILPLPPGLLARGRGRGHAERRRRAVPSRGLPQDKKSQDNKDKLNINGLMEEQRNFIVFAIPRVGMV